MIIKIREILESQWYKNRQNLACFRDYSLAIKIIIQYYKMQCILFFFGNFLLYNFILYNFEVHFITF